MTATQIILLAMLIWWIFRDIVAFYIALRSDETQTEMLNLNKDLIDMNRVQQINTQQPSLETIADLVAHIIKRKKLPTEPRAKY